MKTFYFRVFDYIYRKRLELFQSLFYDLYRSFDGKHEEFLKTWFESYMIKKLFKYFPIEDVITYYPQFALRKRSLVASYVKTYWRFCQKPNLYPAKIRESMEFFGLNSLNEQELKRAYRKLVKLNHPDKAEDKRVAHKKMLLINYHYQVLIGYIRRFNNA
ncbi:J domain-containing protein [Pampinifervens florentissimum]|uniref:J domain-containing protein n=1 Tax=Pampinifervens florentissimum TaxID=1632019 RepID=UPI0020C249C4|nr:DnaJ domain-containing protein [Hydrogenobacter sp. T-8]